MTYHAYIIKKRRRNRRNALLVALFIVALGCAQAFAAGSEFAHYKITKETK